MFSDELEHISWEETTARIHAKTDADVRRALSKEHCNVEDFMALISPAAAPYLETMARLSKKYTEARFGKTISMFVPLYITNSCTNSCVYCGFHISNPCLLYTSSTMAAIIALPDEKVEEICAQVSAEGEVCVAANYNCPGQIVISGSIEGINKACELMKAAGAKRALPLKVGGAFHSPLMNPAKVELEAAINATEIHAPKCPVYQNVDAMPHTDPVEIKKNLVAQLTASVRWTQTVKNMVADGATDFTECGPGAVLQGLIKKIAPEATAHGIA